MRGGRECSVAAETKGNDQKPPSGNRPQMPPRTWTGQTRGTCIHQRFYFLSKKKYAINLIGIGLHEFNFDKNMLG